MAELTLKSNYTDSLKPIIEGVLSTTLRNLEEGIKETQARLQAFEEKYEMSTKEFLRLFQSGELQHQLDMEFDEWMGEEWMLRKLEDKKERIQGIEIVD